MTITLTCRVCGDMYTLEDGAKLRACPSCGTMNARPKAEGVVLDVLMRASKQRLMCDFINAEKSYQDVLMKIPREHEALWGLALCRYGVEYVEETGNGQRLPVVHTVRRRPMMADPDFLQACEFAPEEIRAQYEGEAAYIDRAMAEILRLSENLGAYDVFLCHKTTRPGTKEFTQDYNRAFSIYHKLTLLGYRVFFAPEELKNIAGAAYEAGIYHALKTSRMMLVVCSDPEYLLSPWVRSEWKRYLELSYEEGADKRLLPLLYDGLKVQSLPAELRQLQGLNMGELDSTEALLAAVRRQVGEGIGKDSRDGAGYPGGRYTSENLFRTEPYEDGCRIVSYVGPGDCDIIIPDTIRGQKVVEFGDAAFGDGRTPLRIGTLQWPAGVSNFFATSFAGVRVEQFAVAESNPFYYEEDGVVFRACDQQLCCYPSGSRRTEYEVPEGTLHVFDDAFQQSEWLESVFVASTVRSIGDSAFMKCHQLREISLPEGLESIGEWCFAECSALQELALPSTLTRLGKRFQLLCGAMESIRVASGNPYFYSRDGVLFGRDHTLICYPMGKARSSFAVPGRVETIADSAFSDADGLTAITLPDSVRSIAHFAFFHCSGLKSLTIPAGVADIAEDAFRDCPELTLRVIEGSPAHRYAQQNRLRFEVVARHGLFSRLLGRE